MNISVLYTGFVNANAVGPDTMDLKKNTDVFSSAANYAGLYTKSRNGTKHFIRTHIRSLGIAKVDCFWRSKPQFGLDAGPPLSPLDWIL